MLRLHSEKGVRFCDGLTRRDFMRVGSVSAGAIGLMVEIHPDPDHARSEGAQSMTFTGFEDLLGKLRQLAAACCVEL